MDGLSLGLFLFAAVLCGFAFVIAGFAVGPVVDIWPHVIIPLEIAALIKKYRALAQEHDVWKLRRSLNWRVRVPSLIAAQVWVRPTTALGGIILLGTITPVIAGPVCRPHLSLTHVALSEMRPPANERRWTATVVADASACALKSGYFEAGFLREKENGMPLEFREQYVWVEPSSLVSVDVSADEAIELAWVHSIQPCTCADAPPDK